MATNTAAIITAPNTPLEIVTRAIPTPASGELLVRNYAIAANPLDWKIQDNHVPIVTTWPNVLGTDVCGVVTAVGPDVTKYKVGDRVAGVCLSHCDGSFDKL